MISKHPVSLTHLLPTHPVLNMRSLSWDINEYLSSRRLYVYGYKSWLWPPLQSSRHQKMYFLNFFFQKFSLIIKLKEHFVSDCSNFLKLEKSLQNCRRFGGNKEKQNCELYSFRSTELVLSFLRDDKFRCSIFLLDILTPPDTFTREY